MIRLDVAAFIPLVSGVKSVDIKWSSMFSITELLMFSLNCSALDWFHRSLGFKGNSFSCLRGARY